MRGQQAFGTIEHHENEQNAVNQEAEIGEFAEQIGHPDQNDSYGQSGLAGVERALKKRNLAVVATGTVERNTVDVAKAVASIKGAQPQAVVMISA